MKTIADHLRKRRLDLNMTQNEVATRLQTTADTARNWEKDRSSPAIQFMPKIIEFLGYIPVEDNSKIWARKSEPTGSFLAFDGRIWLAG
ncbi:MAG: helix-turn-helix transcriptional regulator [Phycisphaerales bacterium]|nr:MAG: helix-turn-helix transcriptional regulator [Phycisphaerales bacterium]